MDLRSLRYFVFVAEARSFSKASVQLRIAQPALSRQIKKLEDELGTPLLLRTGRQLELTEPGLLLLKRAHGLLRQVGQLTDDVRGYDSQVAGTLTVGVSPATCDVLGPLIVRACAGRHPDLRLTFVEGFSGYIFERLVEQELSLCLMHNPPRHKGIDIRPLLVEPLYLVGPGKAAGKTADRIAPVRRGMDVGRLPLVLPNRTHSLRMLVERTYARRGRDITIAIQADGYTMTKSLVAAGVGYTVLPYSSFHQEVDTGELSAVRLNEPDMTWTLSLAYRSEQRIARPVSALRAIIEDEVDALVASRKWRGEVLAKER